MDKSFAPLWNKLRNRLLEIGELVEKTKASSFTIEVSGKMGQGFTVGIGTFDVDDWPVRTYLGPFENEESALAEATRKVEEAHRAIKAKKVRDLESSRRDHPTRTLSL